MKKTVKQAIILSSVLLAATMAAKASDAYVICDTASFDGAWGIASGWQKDDRAAPLRTAGQSYANVVDTSTLLSSSLYREFGEVTGGTLVYEGSVEFRHGFDGLTLRFTSPDGTAAYSLETINGAFAVRQSDGTLKNVCAAEAGKTVYAFRVILDLDAMTAKTVIEGNDCGTDALLCDSVSCFGYTTTEKGTVQVRARRTKLYAGYSFFADFDENTSASIPYGFVSSDVNAAGAKDGELYCGNNGIIRADFEESRNNAFEMYVNAPSDGYGTLSVMGDHGAAYAFSVVGGYFRLGSENICQYVPDLWYRLRFETDFRAGTVLVKLNGRIVGTYSLGEGTTKLTRVSANFTSEAVRFDNMKLFPLIEHEDYVPAPVAPRDTAGYLVGVNTCPLWNNDTHYGWGLITPYEKPVLGWYDEGDPETADWEIKYLVEHGVDFQTVCWYPENADKPLKTPKMSEHLHDGYMNAKYADRMKYCILWECKNAAVPTSLDDAKKYFVPYIVENYFKDPRYLVIDNKPVFGFFSVGSLMNALTYGTKDADEPGDWKKVKPLLDHMEDEAKKLGFDGVTFLSTDASNVYLKNMGIDASFAYGFGKDAYTLQYNKDKNLANASDTSVYTIPTVCVGFNNIAWNGEKSPMLSVSDFAAAQEWVKSTYLPAHVNPLGVKAVMISNWNEYGEGTYIFPSQNNGGFGYLDALRTAYTDESANATLNAVPTAAALARITRKYPQNVVRIRTAGEKLSDTAAAALVIDGETYLPTVNPESKSGTVYFPFDTDGRLHELLNIRYAFDGSTLTLEGEGRNHTVRFTIGSATAVTKNGDVSLPAAVYVKNGFPMLPLETMLDALGLAYEVSGTTYSVQTGFYNRIPLGARIAATEESGTSLKVTAYTPVALGLRRTAVFAAYDADGRLIDTRLSLPGGDTTFSVLLKDSAAAALVKLFVFDGMDTLRPVCESAKALGSEESFIDIGGFWN